MIPDAAIEAAADAMDVGMWVAFDRRDHLELVMHVAIKAAMPAIREAIAQEIEAADTNEAVYEAASIVRGGTP